MSEQQEQQAAKIADPQGQDTHPLVELTHVEKHFGHLHVLKDINLAVNKGEVLVVVGPSGSGKSTMCRTINRLETIDSGDIRIDGKPLPQEGKELAALRAEVGMVFQSFNLFANKTILENVTLAPIKVRHMPKDEAENLAMDLLARVGVDSQAEKMPAQLSGGQQQRVAIARALVKEPRLLLLDEPLSNLDARLRLEMREEIRRIQLQTQVTTIFVTHDQEEAMSISDHIVLMKDGVMQQFDQPQVLYDDPANQFVADFLGNPPINNIPGTVKGGVFTTEDGKASVALPMLEKVPDGAKVNLSVRSESFTVQPDGAPGTLQCQVTGVFKTGKEEMAAFLFGDVPFRAYIDLEEGLQKGQTVSLGLKKRGVFVFDRETGRRYV